MMTAFAIDVFAPVLRRGIVHRHQHRFVQKNKVQNRRRQDLAQRPQRPDRARKDPVIAAVMTGEDRSHRPQDRRHRSSARRQDGADSQRNNALERWLGKCGRKTHEKRLRCRWDSKHNGLLSDLLTLCINENRQESVFCARNFLPVNSLKNGKSRAKYSSF